MKNIYSKFKANYLNNIFILLIDSALSHLKNLEITENIKIITKGATSLVQTLDIVIAKCYKDFVRKEFFKYFVENRNNLTKSRKIKKPCKENTLKIHSIYLNALQIDKIVILG